jgi:integrase
VQSWDAATLRTFLTRSHESGDRLHALWVLLGTAGMRRGEAIGLRWKDIDLDKGRLSVVQTITQTRSKVTVGEPKTARGRRSIALDEATVGVLRDHRKAMLEERMLVGPDFSDGGLVFHHPDGSCVRPDAVSAQFVRRVGQYDLPRLTLHGLRHTWATLALEQGIHPRVVQERLGHSTIAITLGIYSHVSPTLHDEAAGQVASLFL